MPAPPAEDDELATWMTGARELVALNDPLGAAADMVKFAIDAGGADNIHVVLIPYLGPEAP